MEKRFDVSVKIDEDTMPYFSSAQPKRFVDREVGFRVFLVACSCRSVAFRVNLYQVLPRAHKVFSAACVCSGTKVCLGKNCTWKPIGVLILKKEMWSLF